MTVSKEDRMAKIRSKVKAKAVKDTVVESKASKLNAGTAVTGLIASLNTKFGKGSFFKLDDTEELEVAYWILTGIPQLDYAIGGIKHPGIPGGRILEIYGAESHGKTAVALTVTKAVVNYMEGLVLYQDSEFALSEDRVKDIVDMDNPGLIFSQPDSMEAVFKQQEAFMDNVKALKTDLPVAIIWDSVASAPTESEIKNDFGDSVMGVHARLMSQSLRKLRGEFKKNGITAIYLNQVRDKVGVIYGEKTTTFGGRALKFYASVRICVTRIQKLEATKDKLSDEEEVKSKPKDSDSKKDKKYRGIRVKAEMTKNKVAPPFQTCEFDILFDRSGIDQVGSVLVWLKTNSLIGGGLGFYELEGKKYRLADAREVLEGNKKLFDKYLKLCYKI